VLIDEVFSFGLAIAGLGLLIFSIGAMLGWAWAVKSLDVPPPRWIAGVTLAAGSAMVASALLRSDWVSAVASGLLFATVVAGQLRVGPWRSRSGG
jgi:hypothetical protein